MSKQVDMLDGTFDNTVTKRREVYTDGALRRYAGKSCCGYADSSWSVMRKPWGTYPDYPHSQPQQVAA